MRALNCSSMRTIRDSQSICSQTITKQFTTSIDTRACSRCNRLVRQAVVDDELDQVLARYKQKESAAKEKRVSPKQDKKENNEKKKVAFEAKKATKAPAATPKKKQNKKPSARTGVDSISLSKKESDRLFDMVSQSLAAKGVDLELDEGGDESELLIPDSLSLEMLENGGIVEMGVASSSASAGEFKGFGAPPRELQQAQAQKKPQESPMSTSIGAIKGPKNNKMPALRLFIYAADCKQTQEALEEAGWNSLVEVSEDLRSAHVVVSSKVGKTGKHHNVLQGQRTAKNQGIPFVCVGRRMSRDNLVLSLAPILHEHRAKYGATDKTVEDLMRSAGVSESAIKQQAAVAASKLQPGWKEKMLEHFGMAEQTSSDLEEKISQLTSTSTQEKTSELAAAGK